MEEERSRGHLETATIVDRERERERETASVIQRDRLSRCRALITCRSQLPSDKCKVQKRVEPSEGKRNHPDAQSPKRVSPVVSM